MHHELSELFQQPDKLPEWVIAWHESEKKELTKEQRAEQAKINAANRRTNRDKRITGMQEGARELRLWLSDLVYQGLANAQSQPAAFWEDFAAQMVDRKLSGVARVIRSFPFNLSLKEGFKKVIPQIADLYLLAKGLETYDELPVALQQQLLQVAGLNVKKEEVKKGECVVDYWLVIGKKESNEEKLQARYSWLIGQHTGKIVLLLDFAWGNQSFETEWLPGRAYAGEMVHYPGTFNPRALFKAFEPGTEAFKLPEGIPNFETLRAVFLEAVSKNPWLDRLPVLLDRVTAIYTTNGNFFLRDETGKSVSLESKHEMPNWKIMAVSSGHPISLFGEWDSQYFVPITAIFQNRIIPLQNE